MGIADIRITVANALAPLGKVSNVRMGYLGGGKQQVISFILTATDKNKSTTSEHEILVAGGQDFMPALQKAAAEFVANFPQRKHDPQ
jgi:hypothetical protein